MAIRRPEVLVLDEPTSAMDPTNRAHVAAAIARGFRTVVFVTHDAELVDMVASRVLVMGKGQILDDQDFPRGDLGDAAGAIDA
jgi:energy-coupling factor transporter ATP-binding protein EcfA2